MPSAQGKTASSGAFWKPEDGFPFALKSIPEFSKLPLCQTAPFRRGTPQVGWRGSGGFTRARINLTRFSWFDKIFESESIVIETFRVVQPSFDVPQQLMTRGFKAPRHNVQNADLALDFALAVLLILVQYGLEFCQRILEPALL